MKTWLGFNRSDDAPSLKSQAVRVSEGSGLLKETSKGMQPKVSLAIWAFKMLQVKIIIVIIREILFFMVTTFLWVKPNNFQPCVHTVLL
jgi:hypothetical protein